MGMLRSLGVGLGFVDPVRLPELTPDAVRSFAGAAWDAPAPTPPARPDATGTVTVDTALSVGAVYRCVSILVTSVAQMHPEVYRGTRQMRAPAIIARPTTNGTATSLLEETVFSLATTGNAYWRIVRDDKGNVASVWTLDPAEVSVHRNPDTGVVTYGHRGGTIAPSQIKHLKLIRRAGHALGLGPIQTAHSEIAAAIRLRRFADTWFDTSGTPTGVLSTDRDMNPEESRAFIIAWKRFLAEHNMAVAPNGIKYAPVHLKPAEAQFLEVQNAQHVSIARVFGIPAMWLLAEIATGGTYVNSQDTSLAYLQTTLQRYVSEIEEALTSLLPRGTRVVLAEGDLLRMNSKLRAEIDVAYVGAGLRTVDELRARDNLEPLPKPPTPPAPPAPADTPNGDADGHADAA